MFTQLSYYSSESTRTSSGQGGLNLPWRREKGGLHLRFSGVDIPSLASYIRSWQKSQDAASVRATHPIPAACGIYYFEVKIVSKGRDG